MEGGGAMRIKCKIDTYSYIKILVVASEFKDSKKISDKNSQNLVS